MLQWQVQQAGRQQAAGCQLTSQLTREGPWSLLPAAWCLPLEPGLVPGGTFGSNRMLHATFRGGTNVTPLDDGPTVLSLLLGPIFFYCFLMRLTQSSPQHSLRFLGTLAVFYSSFFWQSFRPHGGQLQLKGLQCI